MDRKGSQADDIIIEMEKISDDASSLSLGNYSDWRDYLHKYYLFTLAIAGGFGIYGKINQLSTKLGLIFIVTGALVGFLLINLYLYWERKHIRFVYDIKLCKPYKFFSHPDVDVENIPLALKRNFQDVLLKDKDALRGLKNKDKRKLLINRIRNNKREIKLIKYWNMYGFEGIWFIGVAISLILTFLGIILIFISF